MRRAVGVAGQVVDFCAARCQCFYQMGPAYRRGGEEDLLIGKIYSGKGLLQPFLRLEFGYQLGYQTPFAQGCGGGQADGGDAGRS